MNNPTDGESSTFLWNIHATQTLSLMINFDIQLVGVFVPLAYSFHLQFELIIFDYIFILYRRVKYEKIKFLSFYLLLFLTLFKELAYGIKRCNCHSLDFSLAVLSCALRYIEPKKNNQENHIQFLSLKT